MSGDEAFSGRIEDDRLITGAGAYLADLKFDDLAHLAVVRAEIAHGRITAIETDAARAMPGVLAVLTGDDYRERGLGAFGCMGERHREDGAPMHVPPRRPLALDEVKHAGEAVAVVVAESTAEALDAAEAVYVSYDSRPVVAGTGDAAQPGAPKVWDETPDNIAFSDEFGDAAACDEAFAAAAHIVEQRFINTRVAATPIEPRGAVGMFDEKTGRYTLYAGVQTLHGIRLQLAQSIFGIDPDRLRLISPDTGGGFGMKGGVYGEYALVLWAAEILGRPVRWLATRSESFLADEHARDSIYDAALALDADGKFLAARVECFGNIGAYVSDRSLITVSGNIGGFAGVYDIPAMHARAHGVFSNTPMTAPYRGAGRPEASSALERLIDKAARKLALDPAELRRLNVIAKTALPYKTALTYTYDSGAFGDNLERALELADYAGFAKRAAASAQKGQLRGIGISNTVERAAGPAPLPDKAKIVIAPEGAVTVTLGCVTQGQGHETTFLPLIRDRLGLEQDAITFVTGDSDVSPYSIGTFGSRSAAMASAALADAVDRLIEAARVTAAAKLGVETTEIAFDDGLIRHERSNQTMTLEEVAASTSYEDDISGDASPGLMGLGAFQASAPSFPNGVHICEVEIDPETGACRVEGYALVDDFGTVLNHTLAEGQVHGGVAQAASQILMEQLAFDPHSGQLVTGSFMDYAMIRAGDFVEPVSEFNQVATKVNPLGVKGAGEAGTVGAYPAVMNAIEHALSARGVEHIDMPATPPRIWQALKEVED